MKSTKRKAKATKSSDVTAMSNREFAEHVKSLLDARKEVDREDDELDRAMVTVVLPNETGLRVSGFCNLQTQETAATILNDLGRYLDHNRNPFARMFGN